MINHYFFVCYFFFNGSATTKIYTLSLHDALPILRFASGAPEVNHTLGVTTAEQLDAIVPRSEEHTSELQSHSDLVCRLLLEKKQPSGQPPVFRLRKSISCPRRTDCTASVWRYRIR